VLIAHPQLAVTQAQAAAAQAQAINTQGMVHLAKPQLLS